MKSTACVLVPFLTLLLAGCGSRGLAPYKQADLPDEKIYSAIIREILIQDSISFNRIFLQKEYISTDLLKLQLIKLTRMPESDVVECNANSHFRTTIAELNWYNIADSLDLPTDSAYFSLQSSSAKQTALDTGIIDFILPATKAIKEKYEHEKYFGYYQFSVPMLNNKLNRAYVLGDFICNNCGHGEVYILEKKNNKWVLTFSKTTWQN